MQIHKNVSYLVSKASLLALFVSGLGGLFWIADPISFCERADQSTQESSPLREFNYSQFHMAMEVRITVWGEDQEHVEAACKAAFRRISQLEKIFSDYDSNSEVRRLARDAVETPQPVSDELLYVLMFSQDLYRKSTGAFDPTGGPIIQLWREARKKQQLPDKSLLERARQRVGFENIKIDQQQKTVQFDHPDMQLDFGGIAKGYIGDQVLELLRSHGIRIARYQAGGDFVLGDPPPNTEGWPVGIESGEILRLANCGIAVSGDSVQFVEIDGVRYSHIIDPRTGEAVTHRRSATVIAPNGMQSDALATTGCVLDEHDLKKLLSEFANTRGWIRIPETVHRGHRSPP